MKKIIAFILATVMLMATLTACGSKNNDDKKGGTKTAADLKIVLLLPGEINDQGWNASNYAGVVACNEKLGTKMEYVESVKEADFESTFREYAERGYDIIMAAGSQFDEAASSVAANYPNTRFMVVNGSKCDADNLCPLFPKEYEASYLAAVIAGHITANGQFGLIGGDPNQAMKDLMAVYGKTAVSIAKDRGIADASYNLAYSNSWTDVALGKQMSENMIDNGADVMFVYANELGLGVINGAVEKGAKVVGYSSDQTTIDPKTVVASIDFDYATMYVWAIDQFLAGKLAGHQIVEVGVPENVYFPVYTDNCPAEAKTACDQAVADLKAGKVDIVIGTHRLLSKDVTFKQLGLLIIDEEQRFGVTHKEKIKQMKENVDVLTLTATPIPRTLHMSLIGIRDMSVLEEPPMDRMPIQTYVMEYDEETVREAINRELRRGGQVYYVYNRVTDIADVALRIAKLVPDARVDFAHGQMSERELENVMYSFVNGDIDVLVSTTIIETGLDISNVNTMIIHDSDRYGLSQLYQLRGRIGRSNRTAYAFLMYRKNVMLKETAEKRLAAIREYTDLGSGFKIAMRDLELRGAGNLLGAQQHGHMNAVGYDLYCKMLNEAVKEAKGIHTMEDFETSVDLNVDAYIPDSYISNEFQKLDIYKRIAGIETQQDYDDMLEELLDRFGEPGKAVLNLLAIAKLKAIAHQGYVTEIKQTGKTVRFTLYEKARLNTEGFPALMQKYRRGLQFKNEQEPKFILEPQGNLILALTEFAEELKSMAENM